VEVVHQAGEAVEYLSALRRRFQADELKAQRSPPMIDGLTVTQQRL